MRNLPRFTLLNTRPEHQAEGLSESVKQAGGQVLYCPTLEIQWDSQKDLRTSLSKDLEQYDKVILTSVNAVQGVLRSHLKLRSAVEFSKTQFFAIGKATQQAALDVQLPVACLGKGPYDSETLLEHPAMQAMKGQSILIVKGQAGRNLLMDQLTARGGLVDYWDVYKRVSAPFCPQAWRSFINASQPILLITSVASFESLMANLLQFETGYQLCSDGQKQSNQAWSFLSNTIVFSQRIKQVMFQQGWPTDIQVVTEQSDLGIIQTIEQSL